VEKKQLSALLRKSLSYQKKNYCTNACLVFSPVILIGLLGVMQFLINTIVGKQATVRSWWSLSLLIVGPRFVRALLESVGGCSCSKLCTSAALPLVIGVVHSRHGRSCLIFEIRGLVHVCLLLTCAFCVCASSGECVLALAERRWLLLCRMHAAAFRIALSMCRSSCSLLELKS
jgi:hypothetical protein